MLTSSAIAGGLADDLGVKFGHEGAGGLGQRPRWLDAEPAQSVEAVEVKAGGVD
jgi:hypothetical protein